MLAAVSGGLAGSPVFGFDMHFGYHPYEASQTCAAV